MSKPLSRAAVIAAVVSATATFTAPMEGEVLHIYRDPVGIPTYCNGETQNPIWEKTYTHAECQALLRKRLAQDFAPAILRCVPGLIDQHSAFQASLDAAYNAGPGAFCRSPMAAHFNAGRWKAGCTAFVGWRVTAGGKALRGLVTRRIKESRLCLDTGNPVRFHLS